MPTPVSWLLLAGMYRVLRYWDVRANVYCSDTTAATLAWISYELCKNTRVQAKLRKQIDEIAPGKSHLDVEDVGNCAFLDGVINETMRLHPAVSPVVFFGNVCIKSM